MEMVSSESQCPNVPEVGGETWATRDLQWGSFPEQGIVVIF